MQEERGQQKQEKQERAEPLIVFGAYFCPQCRSLMSPLQGRSGVLIFECVNCGALPVSFAKKHMEEAVLFRKDLRPIRRQEQPDYACIFDPVMPSVSVQCPECGFGKAVYSLHSNAEETRMVARLMCRSATATAVKCGHVWELSDDCEILESAILIKHEEVSLEEEIQETPSQKK
jgi:DNA-directed RNA polymerase subunit M/transcription elongation factor TFIIS